MFYFILCILPFLSSSQEAQQLPQLDFGKSGIVIKHDPSHFLMNMRFRIQSRFTYEDYDSDNTSRIDTTDFAVRRMRLRFDGHALDPRFLYKIQLSFSRGDMDYDNTAYPNILRDAAVGWKFTPKNTLWVGQMKLPGNRQRVISSGNQELVDRSLLNATFNIDRDMGVQLYNQFGDDAPFWLKLAISNGEGRANNNTGTGLSYTARLEWLPLGKFKDDGDYFEGDLAHEETAKISLGVSYNANKRTRRVGGQIGQTLSAGATRDMETWLADFLFKYQGWAFSSEYADRLADDPIVTIASGTTTLYKGKGLTAQLSYVFANHLSPVIRYTQIRPHDDILVEENNRTQYTLGLTRYFNEHKIKLQGDVTLEKEDNPVGNIDQTHWIARLQLEFGI